MARIRHKPRPRFYSVRRTVGTSPFLARDTSRDVFAGQTARPPPVRRPLGKRLPGPFGRFFRVSIYLVSRPRPLPPPSALVLLSLGSVTRPPRSVGKSYDIVSRTDRMMMGVSALLSSTAFICGIASPSSPRYTFAPATTAGPGEGVDERRPSAVQRT